MLCFSSYLLDFCLFLSISCQKKKNEKKKKKYIAMVFVIIFLREYI